MPDIFKWIIIKHKHYEQVRNFFGKGWANIPQVDQDGINVLKGIKELGAREEDIDVLEDKKFAELVKYFNQVRKDAITAWNVAEKRTMVFVYYSGHGVMDNFTYVVTNETPENG